MKRYIIIGNGTAAAGCIEGIRSVDPNGSITVISAEKHPVYCRPLISYYLEGKTSLSKMNYRPDNFYETNHCTVLFGRRAVKLLTDEKQVVLDNGAVYDYDELCVAAGSTPFVPPMDGLENVKQQFSFMTLEDAFALEKAVTPESRVLIIGAGLIGLKCAEGLHGRVKSITVCDLADRVLSSILDSESAALMQRHLEAHGIEFLLGDSVEQFDGNKALMKSRKQIGFDQLVLAVGVRANTALVQDVGGKCGRGITIDAQMRTSLPHVYAAGDCTESMDISDGTVKVMALMPNAYMQGKCAGVNMAGGQDSFENAIPMNAIGFFGLHALTAGSRFDGENGGEVYTQADDTHIKKLFVKDGRLTGFLLIGRVERAGIYTNMIREQIPISEVDFEMLKKDPNLLAFHEQYRRKKLGGVV